jgi:uncharacterized protein Usg
MGWWTAADNVGGGATVPWQQSRSVSAKVLISLQECVFLRLPGSLRCPTIVAMVAGRTAGRARNEDRQMAQALELQLMGYRLTTAEILYRLPDAPTLLQSYIWQNYDRAPDFPRLRQFLDFWRKNLDGPLHSVKVASAPLIGAARYRHHQHSFRLH